MIAQRTASIRERLFLVAGVLMLLAGAVAAWLRPNFLPGSSVNSRSSPEAIEPVSSGVLKSANTSDSTIQRAAINRRPVLADVAELVGFNFRYYSDGRTDRFFLPEIMGGGAGWLDFDGDGWLDLFVPNGCVLPDTGEDTEHTAHLFRNVNGTQFVDVSEPAAADERGYGQGVCVGDFNNDGFPDIFVTHYGSNRLMANNGDGTFSDVTLQAAIGSTGWSTSCAFGDLDRDGNLDLFVAHYVQTNMDSIPVCTYADTSGRQVRGYCGPDKYVGELDELYCNLGDGTFKEIARDAGCANPEGKGLACVIADLDNDGWPDLYVANDMVRNFLFRNKSGRESSAASPIRFEEDGLASGSALTGQGRPIACMGIACGDYDHNGWLDLYVSNYLDQGNRLFQNVSGTFVEQTAGANLLMPSLKYLGFGTGFFDYDNDGWLDVFVTNGHVLGPLVGPPDRMNGQVFRNEAGGRYAEMTEAAGAYFHQEFFGRGVAFADFTNSGAVGMAVIHQNEPAALLRNDTPNRGHFLGLHLIGRRSNRCALNTRVIVTIDGVQRVAETIGGGSYLSDSDHRLHFGLGDSRKIDGVEVHWPSGAVEQWSELKPDQYWLLIEGQPPRRAPYSSGSEVSSR